MLLVASLATLLYKFSFFIENYLPPGKILFLRMLTHFQMILGGNPPVVLSKNLGARP